MDVLKLIDHTLLKAEATPEQIDKVVAEAREYGFASVCVNGCYVSRVAAGLKDSGVKTCAVAGFPLGSMMPTVKAIEATTLVKDGADEVDFVAHLPSLVAHDVEAARKEYTELVKAARAANPNVVIKVIIESAFLMADVDAAEAEARIVTACKAAQASGVDFVKTSTGFHGAGGATVEAVSLMKKHAGPMKVKASGGIRSLEDAKKMVEAGADRLGCSSGVAIAQGQKAAGNY